jgi:hypothetical protein
MRWNGSGAGWLEHPKVLICCSRVWSIRRRLWVVCRDRMSGSKDVSRRDMSQKFASC